MAHYAKIGIMSKVIGVLVVDDKDTHNADNVEDELVGIEYLTRLTGWPIWRRTSYNTRGGKHYDGDGNLSSDQSKAYRGNFAGIGFIWDEDNDCFWPRQPHASWTKDLSTYSWKCPVDYPTVTQYDGTKDYTIGWDESLGKWTATKQDGTSHNWNPSSKAWDAV